MNERFGLGNTNVAKGSEHNAGVSCVNTYMYIGIEVLHERVVLMRSVVCFVKNGDDRKFVVGEQKQE